MEEKTITVKEAKELAWRIIDAFESARSEFKSMHEYIDNRQTEAVKKKCRDSESYLTNQANFYKKHFKDLLEQL